jgi:uncharacterized protein YndB with AHSA1/START domain
MTMAKIEPIGPYLEPVRKSVTVRRTVEEAFRLFTREISGWWPKDRYSVSQERTRDVVFEPLPGGRVYERRDDGQTFEWGRVLVWEPPRRLVMSWHPGREPDVAQEVEVRFTATDDGGTRVDLEHRNWTRLGAEAADVRDRYAGGWAEVLGKCFVEACASVSEGDVRRSG